MEIRLLELRAPDWARAQLPTISLSALNDTLPNISLRSRAPQSYAVILSEMKDFCPELFFPNHRRMFKTRLIESEKQNK